MCVGSLLWFLCPDNASSLRAKQFGSKCEKWTLSCPRCFMFCNAVTAAAKSFPINIYIETISHSRPEKDFVYADEHQRGDIER